MESTLEKIPQQKKEEDNKEKIIERLECECQSLKDKVNTITDNYVEYKKTNAQSYDTLQSQFDKETKENKIMK